MKQETAMGNHGQRAGRTSRARIGDGAPKRRSGVLAPLRLLLAGALLVTTAGASDTGARVHPTRLSLPLVFEKNTGRYDPNVRFLTRIGGATVFLTGTEAVMVLPSKLRAERQAATGKGQEARGTGQQASGASVDSPAPSGGRGLGGGDAACGQSVIPASHTAVMFGAPPPPCPRPPEGAGVTAAVRSQPSALSPQPDATFSA